MTYYTGMRNSESGIIGVYKDSRLLSPAKSQKIRNHSPDGFEWGYGGSGPAQLALALLLEETSIDEACAYYQAFKWDIVARWDKDGWELPSEQVQSFLAEQRRSWPLEPCE